jgi:hypothetical protein
MRISKSRADDGSAVGPYGYGAGGGSASPAVARGRVDPGSVLPPEQGAGRPVVLSSGRWMGDMTDMMLTPCHLPLRKCGDRAPGPRVWDTSSEYDLPRKRQPQTFRRLSYPPSAPQNATSVAGVLSKRPMPSFGPGEHVPSARGRRKGRPLTPPGGLGRPMVAARTPLPPSSPPVAPPDHIEADSIYPSLPSRPSFRASLLAAVHCRGLDPAGDPAHASALTRGPCPTKLSLTLLSLGSFPPRLLPFPPLPFPHPFSSPPNVKMTIPSQRTGPPK